MGTRSRDTAGRGTVATVAGILPSIAALLLAAFIVNTAFSVAPLAAQDTPPDTGSDSESIAGIESPPGSFSGPVPTAGDSGSLRLPHRHLDPATLIAVTPKGDTLRPGTDFILDPTAGILTIVSGSLPDTLFVSYRYLPVSVVDTLQWRSPDSAIREDSLFAGEGVHLIRSRPQPGPPQPIFGRNLRHSGHILRGLQIGSGRDLSLESGLHLALEGRLSRDIQVEALLDDRNLPIQPEGTSRRLEEIDQVYIDLRAGRGRGRFGDYLLSLEAGRYGTLERRLEGGILEYRDPDLAAGAAGAVTRAVFHTNRFNGADGVQGPYPLTGRDGEQNLIVTGGSEEVWVDGILCGRGETADYTIDYNRGEITFTPRFPITSESRIEVDFEYSPQAFPRNLYTGRAKFTSPSQRFSLEAVAIQEGDDTDRPLAFEMNPSIRALLAGRGDSAGRTLVPAADSLGPGEGDYSRRDTTWTDGLTYSRFVFVPPGPSGETRGEWSVLFSEVGPGDGDYQRRYDPLYGTYVFEWTGPGMGDWAPGRLVPLPERSRLGAVSLTIYPNEQLSLGADLAASAHDLNTLSSAGDEDNVGLAQSYTASYSFPGDGELSPLVASVSLRDEGANFRPFARSREVEYGRRWGLDSLREGTAEREQGLGLLIRPFSRSSLDIGYGHLDRGNGLFTSDRRTLGSAYGGAHFKADAQLEAVASEDRLLRSESDWLRGKGMASYRLGIWVPGVDGEYEDRDASLDDSLFTGHRYRRWRGSWGLAGFAGHGGAVSYERRERDRQQEAGRYAPVYDEDAQALRWTYRPEGFSWFSELELSHRTKKYTYADSADVTTDLAAVRAAYSPLGGAFTSDLNYRLNKTVSRPSVLVAYQVPQGQGDYVRRDDEYVYDPEIGDIILRPEPTGEALPTTDLAAALGFDWSPHRLPGGRGRTPGFGWEDISLETSLEAVEITSWRSPSDIYLLRLSSFQGDSTIQGRLAWRQDVHLFRPSRRFNLRLRYEAEKRLINLYLTGAERFGSDSWELRLRNAVTETIDLEGEGRYLRKSKRLARRDRADRFRLYRWREKASWRLTRMWKVSLELRGLLDRQLEFSEDVFGLGLKPGVTWALRERGRISAEFEALWIETNLERLPFELADGRPRGRNGRGSLRADYRIGDHLTARAIYTLRLDQGLEPIHLARIEASAFF